jgi:hypothetical protein
LEVSFFGSLRALDKNLISQDASSSNFARMLGGAIGVSLCNIVLEWRLAAGGWRLSARLASPHRNAEWFAVKPRDMSADTDTHPRAHGCSARRRPAYLLANRLKVLVMTVSASD